MTKLLFVLYAMPALVFAQSHSIGLGIGTTGYNSYLLQVNDTVFLGNDPGGDPDLSIHYVFEPEVRDFLHLRLGMDYYRIYHSFWVAGVREPFGLIRKGAVVAASTFFIPLQVGVHLGPVELYGGAALSMAIHSKPIRSTFNDVPEVEDIVYKMQRVVKPINAYWMGTACLQISKRFELQGQYVQASGRITKSLKHGGSEQILPTRFARASLAVLYRFEPEKISSLMKRRIPLWEKRNK